MSASKQTKKKPAANIVWFDIPADDMGRAKKFYGSLFGWKISPIPGMPDYLHIDTGGPDASPDGGILARQQPGQQITSYVGVASVSQSMKKVEKLGGKVCVPKTAVMEMGFFAVCQDPEGNTFALWERAKAK